MKHAPLILAYAALLVAILVGDVARVAVQHELAVIAVFGIALPLLYFFNLRRGMRRRSAAVIACLLALSSLSILDWWVFEGQSTLLRDVRPFKLGIALIVIAAELWIAVGISRAAFRSDFDVERVAATNGLPPFLLKLMVIEAHFWKRLWRCLPRRRRSASGERSPDDQTGAVHQPEAR